MNIAIVHYHLNRGGVTRVIESHLQALDAVLKPHERCRAAILYGGRAGGWPDDLPAQLRNVDLQLRIVPRLEYDTQPVAESAELAAQLKAHLGDLGFAPHETLLHVHNHSLGKNAALPETVALLAADGFALLLQIHDFAEDFRPQDYRHLTDALGRERLSARLYPQAPHLHYAVLNRRDEGVLRRAGVAAERLHRLPNPVPAIGPLPPRETARDKLQQALGVRPDCCYVLYPVRCIRRKNIGEALLWAALADERTALGFTLAPVNPAETPRYEDWKTLASELDLPCHFETGGEGGLAFLDNLAAADRILTTSVAEGFGLVFLESWFSNSPLLGRNLPEITRDFVEQGAQFNALYDALWVPVDWIGRDAYLTAIESAYDRVQQCYGIQPLPQDEFLRIIEARIHDGLVDFADLDEALQHAVIRQVHQQASRRQDLQRLNPKIQRALSAQATGICQPVQHNQQVVRERYSLRTTGQRLMNLYQRLVHSPRDATILPPANGAGILSSFLALERFRMIRT